MSAAIKGDYFNSEVVVQFTRNTQGNPAVSIGCQGPNSCAVLDRFELGRLLRVLTHARECMDAEEHMEQCDERRREGSR